MLSWSRCLLCIRLWTYRHTLTWSIISTCTTTTGPSRRPTDCLSCVVVLISVSLSFMTAGITASQSDRLKISRNVTTTSVLSLQRLCVDMFFRYVPFVSANLVVLHKYSHSHNCNKIFINFDLSNYLLY